MFLCQLSDIQVWEVRQYHRQCPYSSDWVKPVPCAHGCQVVFRGSLEECCILIPPQPEEEGQNIFPVCIYWQQSVVQLETRMILGRGKGVSFPQREWGTASHLLCIIICCKQSHSNPLEVPVALKLVLCFGHYPRGSSRCSTVPLVDFSLLEEVNLGINSKYLFKPLFFRLFHAFIFVYVQFLRTSAGVVSMDIDSRAQSTGRFHKHVCKLRAVNHLPSDYISIWEKNMQLNNWNYWMYKLRFTTSWQESL